MQFTNVFNFIMWFLVTASMILYVKLVLTPPGYLEGSMIDLNNLPSENRHDSPRVTNFSQKMSESPEEAKGSPINQKHGSKKYIELEENFGSSNHKHNKSVTNPSLMEDAKRSRMRGDTSKGYRRKSFIENSEGHQKIIQKVNMENLNKSQNADDGERKKIYDQINDRIAHSWATQEDDTDQQPFDDEKCKEFIQQNDEKVIIDSSLFYGNKQPIEKTEKISDFDGSDEEQKEPQEKVTEKIHDFDDPVGSDTPKKHKFEKEEMVDVIVSLDEDEEENESNPTKHISERLDHKPDLDELKYYLFKI